MQVVPDAGLRLVLELPRTLHGTIPPVFPRRFLEKPPIRTKFIAQLSRIVRGLPMRQLCAVVVLSFIAPLLPVCAQGKPPVTPPRLISLPNLDCGAGKPCHHSHGQVRLIVDVLETGKAGDIRAELGDDVLVEAATVAAQQAQFIPGFYQGKPVMMSYVLTLVF